MLGVESPVNPSGNASNDDNGNNSDPSVDLGTPAKDVGKTTRKQRQNERRAAKRAATKKAAENDDGAAGYNPVADTVTEDDTDNDNVIDVSDNETNSDEEDESVDDDTAAPPAPAPVTPKQKTPKKKAPPKAAWKKQIDEAKQRANNAFEYYPDEILLEEIEKLLDGIEPSGTVSSNPFTRRIQDALKKAYNAYVNNNAYTEHLPSRAQVLAGYFCNRHGHANGSIAGHLISMHRVDLMSVAPLVNIGNITAADAEARRLANSATAVAKKAQEDVDTLIDGITNQILPRIQNVENDVVATAAAISDTINIDTAAIDNRFTKLETDGATKHYVANEVRVAIDVVKQNEIATLRAEIVELRASLEALQKTGTKRAGPSPSATGPDKRQRTGFEALLQQRKKT